MQLGSALRQAIEQLKAADVPEPRLDAETLLMHTLNVGRAYLHAHSERELDVREHDGYSLLVVRRSLREPLQYLVGRQEFWGLDFEVSPAVLIPRPETEHSVEAVLALLNGISAPKIADIGTGSGCIALALASEIGDAQIQAIDISPEALEVAKRNALRLKLDRRVTFSQGDLLQPLLTAELLGSFDLIVSNPPYVPAAAPEKVQREVREHEPHVALFGGDTGMAIYERLIPQARQALKTNGWLVMEIGYSIEDQTRALLREWRNVGAKADLQGIPRVLVAQK